MRFRRRTKIENMNLNVNLMSFLKDVHGLQFKHNYAYVAFCPFHSEKNPSFTIYENSQTYKCFSFSKSNDAISFLQKNENCDFKDAVKFISQKTNSPLSDNFEKNDVAILIKIAEEKCVAICNKLNPKFYSFFRNSKKAIFSRQENYCLIFKLF